MAVSFVNATYDFTLSGSSLVGTEPTGTRAGDMLVAIISDVSGTPAGPAGWTQIGANRTASSHTASVWLILRGGAAPSLTWTGLGSSGTDLDIMSYRGALGTLNISGQSAAGSAVAPTVTTTVVNCMLVCFYADVADSSITSPSGMTTRSVGGGSSFNKGAELLLTSAGATGTKTFTTTTTPIGAWSLALAPKLSPPPFQVTTCRVWSTYQ